jgi:Mg-chelatase subunit ChlI/Mg-chelatase subunit ChlD
MKGPVYPFSAILGQERVKTALLLNVIDPRLGGVLITGPKGSGKTIIIRALEDLLPTIGCVEGCSFNCDPSDSLFLCDACRETISINGILPLGHRRIRIVELPVSSTEDSLLGTIDVETTFQEGERKFQPGILGKANHNILYADEINLLPDHLVDCILDPTVSGWNFVKREGLNLRHPSRFTLVASMNPEEGGLRPQILDRFGLNVEMDEITDPKLRIEVVRRNLAYEEDPNSFYCDYQEEQDELRKKIVKARKSLIETQIPDDIMEGIAEACSKLAIEGLRSDISIMKAARALAAFEGKKVVGPQEVMEVFDFAISHRVKGLEYTQEDLEDIFYKGRIKTSQYKKEPEPGGLQNQHVKMPTFDTSMKMENLPSFADKPFSVERSLGIKIGSGMPQFVRTILFVFMLFCISILSVISTLFIQRMVFGLPIENLVMGLTFNRIILHFTVVTILSFLFWKYQDRVKDPIKHFYIFMGEVSGRKLVIQHMQPSHQKEDMRTYMDTTAELTVPLFASLRRIYQMVIEKGTKLLEPQIDEEKIQYKFHFSSKPDPKLKRLFGKQSKTKSIAARGRYVSDSIPKYKPWDIAIGPTLRAAAPHQLSRDLQGLALKVENDDVRVKIRELRTPITIIILLDLSESMASSLINVRNAILSMRETIFKSRDRVGLVIFKGQRAVTLQYPTSNIDLLVKNLMNAGASDFTPLASGMYEAWRTIRNEKNKNKGTNSVLVIISDGIANIPLDAPLSPHTRDLFINHAQADVFDTAYLLKKEKVSTLIINPSHEGQSSITPLYNKEIQIRSSKRWFEPTEFLMQIPKITGGYYYGIDANGKLEQVEISEAFSILGSINY